MSVKKISNHSIQSWWWKKNTTLVSDSTSSHTALWSYNIYDLQQMPIVRMIEILEQYQKSTNKPSELIDRIINPLLDRAKTIANLWLWYLTLRRAIDSLSWWEIQRLRLAKQLGNKLTGIIYVLDEPTIGLDEIEIKKVIAAIKWLQKMGNSIVVVEHNEDFIKASDRVVEVGPGAWDFWGKILYNGSYKDFIVSDSLTAQYITGQKKIQAHLDHTPTGKKVSITWAYKYNLQHISVDIRLWSFTIITWWSWAGKTTLMYHILYKFLAEKDKFIQSQIRLNLLKQWIWRTQILANPSLRKVDYEIQQTQAINNFFVELSVKEIRGYEHIHNVMYVDQSSIGKTPRSCPATFIGVFDHIRNLFAGSQDSKMLGFHSGHFSFNSKRGACPECEWYGQKKIELQFLPDTYVPCDLCRWKRFKSEVLEIKRKGKNIAEVLDMYINDAKDFFSELSFISDELMLMCDIGLWYLKLWQSAHTLSWWESQRIKLVKHLLKQYKGHTIYFLDEPTVWLHPSDIEKLLFVLKKFLDHGDTILMIEHDQNLLQFADDVITLQSGKIVKNTKLLS
jgi:excinuclease ABC subunit A